MMRRKITAGLVIVAAWLARDWACATIVLAGETPSAAADGVEVAPEGLGWYGARLGMTLDQLGAVVQQRVHSEASATERCGGYVSRLRYRDHDVQAQLSAADAGGVVQTLFVRFADAERRLDVVALSAQLRRHVPALRYQPSVHAPGLHESDNPAPLYVVDGKPDWALLVKPHEGLLLALRECVE